jgi:hypothetical protein
METQPPPVPPPSPPFSAGADLNEDEIDVEIDDDVGNDPKRSDATQAEAVEYLGSGCTSLADYFCRELEDHIDESIAWVQTCLDMPSVQRRFEGNGRYRYVFENGSVYRVSAEADPKPTPNEDPPGPWMRR